MISILTICRNNFDGLLKTIDSVRKQSCREYEFIVLDGASTDGTVEFLKGQSDLIWKSEKDDGIADAFNKAALMASGEWLLFLNSGDVFEGDGVIQSVQGFLERCDQNIGVVFGDAMIYQNEVPLRLAIGDLANLRRDNTICHQASFIRRGLQLDFPYDSRLRIGMDYDLWLRLQKVTEFRKIDLTIARYSLGGISSSRRWAEHSIIAHQMVKWMNASPSDRLSMKDVRSLMYKLLVLKSKKMIERVIGEKTYSKLKAAWN